MCVCSESRVPYLEKHIQYADLASFMNKEKDASLWLQGQERQGTLEEGVQNLVPDDGLQACHLHEIGR